MSPASPLGLLCGECPCLTGLTPLAAEGSTCDWGGGSTVSRPGLPSQNLNGTPLQGQPCPTLPQGLWLRPGRQCPSSPLSRGSGKGSLGPVLGPRSQKVGWLLVTLSGPSAGLLLCHFFTSLILEGCLLGPFLSIEGFYSQGCVQSAQPAEEKSGIIISTL